MKKYKITYPIACGVPALATFLLSLFLLKAKFIPCLFLALCAASFGWCISRIVLHLIDKDNKPVTWQLNIYAVLVSAGWTIAVLAMKPWLISAALALVVGCGLMFIGVRFDDANENGVPDGIEAVIKIVKKRNIPDECYDMRYRPREDNLGNAPDETKPMCLVDNVALTINEALAAGHKEEAEEAIKYLKSIIK